MKVTIALATYNVAPYIRESLNRIIGQTLKEIDILCIDDASTDGTVDILREYAVKDKRIRLVEKDTNDGLAVSRNIALEMAQGEYVCFVDGDDLMDVDLMEQAYDLAIKESADVVMWDYYEFGEKLFDFISKDSPSSLIGVSSEDRHNLIKRMAFTWMRLFKTKSIRELNIHFPDGRTKQDQPIHWVTTACLKKISLLPKRKYGYRIRRTQTSARRGRVLLDILYVADYTEKEMKRCGIFDEYSEDFYIHQLVDWYNVYCFISASFKNEVLNEIRKRFKSNHKEILCKVDKRIKWFYYGMIENNFLFKMAYLQDRFLRKVYRYIKISVKI